MVTLRAIRRVLWITLGLNLVATAAKLIVGYWTGSLSLLADGFDSVFDAASNVIGLVGIFVAGRPADAQYPYGRRKAETITALAISGLLFVTTWELIQSAVERLRDPSLIQAEVNVWSFAALLVSIGVHVLVVWYEMRAGRRLGSDVLVADAMHTRADIFVSLSVVAGLVVVRLGVPLADPILALVVALFIAKIGIDIIRESTPTLMDRAVMPADEMERIACSVPGVRSCHRIRSRGHEQAVYADLHVRVDAALSTDRSHAIAHEVQRRLLEARPDIQDVTVHVEPNGALPEAGGREQIAVQLRRLATGLGLSVHDVWAYEIKGKYYVETHLEVDGALSLREAHELASELERRARQDMPQLVELTTHIEPRGELLGAGDFYDVGRAELAQLVQQVIESSEGAENCHDVQLRQYGGKWVVSLHCDLPGELPLVQAHLVSATLEARLREEIPGLERVVIHTEPRE